MFNRFLGPLVLSTMALAAVCSHALANETDAPSIEIGDTWIFKGRNNPVVEDVVTKIEDGNITIQRTYNNDPKTTHNWVFTAEWNEVVGRIGDGREFKDTPAGTTFKFPMALGMEWKSEARRTLANRGTIQSRVSRVEAVENITVPAGTFQAYKIVAATKWSSENTDSYGMPRAQGSYNQTYWYAPEINRYVKFFEDGTTRLELIEYKKSRKQH